MLTHNNTLNNYQGKDNAINEILPEFDYENIEIKPEDIKADIKALTTKSKSAHHKDVLQKLLEQIIPIDFVLLIRPEI